MHLVHKLCVRPDHPPKSGFDDRKIGAFEVLAEKIRRNLYGKSIVLERNRNYRLEPDFKRFLVHEFAKNSQARLPHRN